MPLSKALPVAAIVIIVLLNGVAAVQGGGQAQFISAPVGTPVVLRSAAAAVAAKPAHQAASTHHPLLTYYFDAWQPQVQLSAQQAQRQGRTGVTVTLPKPSSVSRFMPVMSPTDPGMTHEVVDTWEALKGYAMMFSRVNALNQQQPSAPRLFPLPGIAVAAASDTKAAARMDVGRFINEAEAQGRRGLWTETSPGNVLLQPNGQSVAAVADIMGIFYDEAAASITLELDLVHEPRLVSEFIAHGPQTLHAHTSHYHLLPPPGVSVDAARLLAQLQASAFEVPAVHMFMKGHAKKEMQDGGADTNIPSSPLDVDVKGCRKNIDISLNCKIVASFTSPADNTVYDAGTEVKVQGHLEFGPDSDDCIFCSPDTVIFRFNKSVEVVDSSKAQRTQRVTEVAVNANANDGDKAANPWVKIVGDGAVVVTIAALSFGSLTPASITVIWPAAAVSHLSLTPIKAHWRVHDSITITATALDSTGSAVAGAAVTFAAVGDCDPEVAQQSTTADTLGQAILRVRSRQPCLVAVVAVATSPSGARVVSPESHVTFFNDEANGDHEKPPREYYGRHERDTYAEAYPDPSNAEAYAGAGAAGSDAQRFAEAATKQALADHDAAVKADAATL